MSKILALSIARRAMLKIIKKYILYFLIKLNKTKKNIYIATSTETLHMGALKECPLSKPQEEIKKYSK